MTAANAAEQTEVEMLIAELRQRLMIGGATVELSGQEIDLLCETIEDHEQHFDLCWKADMRAIKRWQAETGRDLTWPDHVELVIWLGQERDKLLETLTMATQELVAHNADYHHRTSKDVFDKIEAIKNGIKETTNEAV